MNAIAWVVLSVCILGAMMLILEYEEEPSLSSWALGELVYIVVGTIATIFLCT